MKQHIKDYARSSALTFLTGFGLELLPALDTLSLADFRSGAYVGIIFVAARGGLRALIQAFLAWRTKK